MVEVPGDMMQGSPVASPAPRTYALVSHESAVEAIWALASRRWEGVLDNEGIWLVPAPESCVTTQREVKALECEVDLAGLGITRRPIDLLVPNKSCYSRGRHARFHVWSDFFPERSFVRVHDRVFVSTPYFTVLQLAMARRAAGVQAQVAARAAEAEADIRAQMGLEEPALHAEDLAGWDNAARLVRAVQVLSDFMGTYRYIPSMDGEASDIVYQTKPLVRSEVFDAYLCEMGTVRGISRARKVASLACAGAASPMETALSLMLGLPTKLGGYGLPKPQLNKVVPIGEGEQALVSQDEIIADMCWSEARVIIEYYGWDEHFGAGPKKVASDMARANSLRVLGWTVLQVTYEQARTLAGMTLLARQLAHALGVELPQASELELVWRSRLLAMLLPRTARVL